MDADFVWRVLARRWLGFVLATAIAMRYAVGSGYCAYGAIRLRGCAIAGGNTRSFGAFTIDAFPRLLMI